MIMTGIGSGIDYEAMIQAIVAAERAPKDNQINRQEGMNTAEIEALKEIQNAINSFRDTVEDLGSKRELEKLKATLSNEDFLSVAVDANAVPGEYNFDVKKLAAAQRDQVFKVSEDTTFTQGEIKFGKPGEEVTIDIAKLKDKLVAAQDTKKTELEQSELEAVAKKHGYDLSDPAQKDEAKKALTDPSHENYDKDRHDTYEKRLKAIADEKTRLSTEGVKLDEIQKAINTDPNNKNVKATLVRSGDGISMVLNATDTGVKNQFGSVSVNGLVTKNNTLPADAAHGVQSLQAAADAEVMFGSMKLTSASNKMENAIDGITLNLKAEGKVNVKVESDQSAVKDNVKKFVDEYNKIMETVNTYTKSSEDKAAALSGNASVRSMTSRLRGVISDEYNASTFVTLSQLGITTSRKGVLEIDDTKLDKAIKDDFEQVSNLFVGTETQPGMMDKMLTVLDDYHKNGGIYDQRTDQLEYNNKQLEKEREQLDERMKAKTLSLRAYYAQMDTKIANMNQTQSMLIGMLA
ncbi:flagellar hook-associated protein FliD [Photobacterium jeanii]|uniref:Flagellar hook-associated protein 2 n=1 Tax=Photobacterium jeanii TaxID=858640 RepID=A0A178KIA8_9GAMM|nr:flagellar filament capping protein FliD [Photobacterium jeanii]OAN16725.1 flagellar hook-associated protein FliD [Photobacterium jeanii]PST87455.1 flagellar hook-associated protein FliD [Photobacterium jeanii]